MIAVIGAGPAGCMYASHVKDAEVHIFEEDIQVGTPVSCTGILTDSVRSVIGDIPEDLVVSRIRAFRLAAPNGRSMLVDLDRVNMIVDRARFDRFLLQKALDNGAVLHFGESFTGYERRGATAPSSWAGRPAAVTRACSRGLRRSGLRWASSPGSCRRTPRLPGSG